MSSSSTDTNILIGRFMNLQESWEDNPDATDWAAVDAIARDGALAYNDGSGHAFHYLMLDGVPHTAFHERFLKSSLDAGFDPFKLTSIGQGSSPTPVLDHDALAEAAKENASSAAMLKMIREFASKRSA
jgi:hypothetical protein